MEFIETAIFTKQITELIDDDSYKSLQSVLLKKPDTGQIIPKGGGIRKLRWALPGKGKSGGIRVIYYLESENQIYMLFAYQKNKQENLTQEQLEILARYVKENLK